MTFKIGDTTLDHEWAYVAIAVLALAGIVFLLSIGLLIMWIKYSWIDRHNSKNWTGADVADWILKKHGVNAEMQSSIWYAKYWNHNQRKGTFKLRPWTYSRQSIWTLMEASQQAYASAIRANKGATFWLLFRMPGILRAAGIILGAVFFYFGLRNVNDTNNIDWAYIGIGVSVVFITYLIADCGRVWILWRNVPKLLKESGLQDWEVKAINRIYFWRLVYAIAVVILEIIKMILQIAIKANENKKR